MAKRRDNKQLEKLVMENEELKGALKAFGRLEITIGQIEKQLQQDAMQKFALMEYSKTLGGSEDGFKLFLQEKMDEELKKQEGGAKVDILGPDGKPLTTEEPK